MAAAVPRFALMIPVRMSFSTPPRNSTPCGITVAPRPSVEHGEHVLGEHQVGLLADLRREPTKGQALRVGHAPCGRTVIL